MPESAWCSVCRSASFTRRNSTPLRCLLKSRRSSGVTLIPLRSSHLTTSTSCPTPTPSLPGIHRVVLAIAAAFIGTCYLPIPWAARAAACAVMAVAIAALAAIIKL